MKYGFEFDVEAERLNDLIAIARADYNRIPSNDAVLKVVAKNRLEFYEHQLRNLKVLMKD